MKRRPRPDRVPFTDYHEESLRRIVALGEGIEGITVSGGEPLQQRAGLLALLQRLRATRLSVLVALSAISSIMFSPNCPELISKFRNAVVRLAGWFELYP